MSELQSSNLCDAEKLDESGFGVLVTVGDFLGLVAGLSYGGKVVVVGAGYRSGDKYLILRESNNSARESGARVMIVR